MASLALAFDILARDRGASRTFDRVANAADRAGQKGESFGTRIQAGFGKLARVGVLAGSATAAIGGIAIAAGGMGVKTAAANEQAEIAFTTMLGSAKKAGSFLKELQAFAAKTPFEFPELQTAASSLISAGINADKVIPIMTTLGDVTAGMGTGAEGVKRATVALQQMSAAGRITGEDLNQLRDAGIPVYDLLAKATGKSKAEVVKLAQAGKLGKKELGQMMKALESGKGLERFAGLMDKQSASLSGMWSTFKDTLGQGLAKAILPVIPLLKDGLGKASEFLARALPKVAEGLASVVKWITGSLIPFGGKVVGVLQDMRQAFMFGDEWESHSPFESFAKGARVVVDFIRTSVIPAIQAFGGWLKDDLWPALKEAYQTILPAFKTGLDIIKGAFKGSGEDGAGFSEHLKQIGKVITEWVIPFVAKMIEFYLPLLATHIRVCIETTKFFWKAFQQLGLIVGKVVSFVLKRFADLAGMAATVFDALSHVPGFGWAKDAANKMKAAAGKADDLARAIDNIERDVTIGVSFKATSGRIKVGGQLVNVGARARGGPVRAGDVYAVGENPDGSWNPTTELFVSKSAGTIYNQKQLAGMNGGGGAVEFSEATLQRLAALLSQVRMSAKVSVGAVDAAMGGALR